ncbi:MAG: TraR/DksA family transcriptional regulator [Syntrophobacteraceae bacterium]
MRALVNSKTTPYARVADQGGKEPMDEADMASHHCDQALVHTFHHRNQQLANEIRSAIQRIDEGEFGTCALCSDSIGLERLRARPTAMLCIRCQETMEAVRRRFYGAKRSAVA